MKKVQDHYFRRAQKEGYSARSAYKLEEIDRRNRLLKKGMRVLDLGCAPGSWIEYTISRVLPEGSIVGVDLQEVKKPFPPRVHLIQGDIFALSTETLMGEGGPFDVIVSDMAPKTTGIKSADAARSAEISRQALILSESLLVPGGSLLVKVFQGAELPELRKSFGAQFKKVTLEKPKASRSESVEVFLLGLEKH